MAYTLNLTEEDMDTIHWVGARYSWSDALWQHCQEGVNQIPEHIAWQIQEAFNADCQGNHSMFPLLNHDSELAQKLFNFYFSII